MGVFVGTENILFAHEADKLQDGSLATAQLLDCNSFALKLTTAETPPVVGAPMLVDAFTITVAVLAV
jgi:hypothetical protein